MFFAKDTSISQFLAHSIHVLNFLEGSAEAQALLAPYGMGPAQMQTGRMLVAQVQMASQQMSDQHSKQKAATATFYAEWKKVRQHYHLHVQAARRCLGRDASHFVTASPKRYLAWLTQSQAFYGSLLGNADYLGQMNELGVATEELQRVSQMLATLIASKDLQAQRHVEKQSVLRQRSLTLVQAKQWFRDLMAVANVAFRQQPVLRNALRPLELSPSTPSKRKANKSSTAAQISAGELEQGAGI